MTEQSADPSRTLEAVFDAIARERMAGVPILNPALVVAAVGFQPWQGYWVGVLTTPWFMNLVACPTAPDDAPDLSKRTLELPSGDYEFTVSREDGLGVFLSCPLISPMAQFAGQDEALAVAREIAERLFQPAELAAEVVEAPREVSRRSFFSAILKPGRAP